jgi:hypothetical protein
MLPAREPASISGGVGFKISTVNALTLVEFIEDYATPETRCKGYGIMKEYPQSTEMSMPWRSEGVLKGSERRDLYF